MKTYLVGGAVRDALMGHAGSDRDWVVVGGTPEALIAQGYQPVGRDFPVFLHPDTHEEYALARTERKTARGYHGFAVHAAPDVTLAQDLARRDLTLNAIAQDAHGQRTDPYGGERDIAAKVLRHVTDAFREDPVRILRVARFAARFPDFTVAPETLTLMREMVASGEVDALVSERVWQELSRGLMASTPSRMLHVLRDCGALQRLLPEVAASTQLDAVLDHSARMNAPLEVRFACVCLDLSEEHTHAVCQRWRVPVACKELAELVAREHTHIQQSGALDAEAVLQLLVRCDALRRPERFLLALQTCECDARGRLGKADEAYAPRPRLAWLLKAAQSVDSARVSAQALQDGLKGPAVGARLDAARLAAMSLVL